MGKVVMRAAGFDFPPDLLYHIEHQVWARLHEDGSATVGITSLGVHLAGDLYMCRPKAVGVAVEHGRGLAVVELAKSIVSVKTPLSGTVLRVNELLATRPEVVNSDPYGEGWLAVIEHTNLLAERDALVRGAAVIPAMEHHAWLMKAQSE